jgi:hypothetical protein
MNRNFLRTCAAFILALAGISAVPAFAESEIEGTWRLVMRELPDGKKITPPGVLGLASWVKGNLNFNVVWRTPDGKLASTSTLSTYKFTDNEFSETLLFQRLVDPSQPQGGALSTSAETKSTPLDRGNGGFRFKLPFDPPVLEVQGDKMTATADGLFVDHWERIR